MCVYGSFDSQFVHLIRNIHRSKNVLNVREHQRCFLKTRAVCNSYSKGNIDRSKDVLAETDMRYVYILRSKRGGRQEMLS